MTAVAITAAILTASTAVSLLFGAAASRSLSRYQEPTVRQEGEQ